MIDTKKLRALAEATRYRPKDSKYPNCDCNELPKRMHAFRQAATPEVILSLLDQIIIKSSRSTHQNPIIDPR